MTTFGIIAEGHTDQLVIEHVLLGFFADQDIEPEVNYLQPPRNIDSGDTPPAGWTLVFQHLEAGGHRKALQANDYLIVHIDTDVCDEVGFDVPRRCEGRELNCDELADAVTARLQAQMGPEFVAAHGQRVLFAVAVNATECWLLPLVSPTKATKIAGCLSAANLALRKAGNDPLSAADGRQKSPRCYRQVAAAYKKKKVLDKAGRQNPSLARFLDALAGRGIVLSD
jgi:hypothetical protein